MGGREEMPFIKGQTAWNKGKYHSEETKRKIADAMKGEKNPSKRPEVREKISYAKTKKPTKFWEGKKRDENTKNKISKTLREKYKAGELKVMHTEQSKKLISRSVKKHHNDKEISKLISEKTKEGMKKSNANKKISLARKGKQTWQNKNNRNEVIKKIKEKRSKQVFPLKDTKIEKMVFDYLDKIGVKYKKHHIIKDLLTNTPYEFHQFDCVIESKKIIIEVNGCYWHGCPKCYPKPNEKQIEWIKRDKEIKDLIDRSDWKIVYIWECELAKGVGLHPVRCKIDAIARRGLEQKVQIS